MSKGTGANLRSPHTFEKGVSGNMVEVKAGQGSRIRKDMVQGRGLRGPRGKGHCGGERVAEGHPSWIKGTLDLHGNCVFLFPIKLGVGMP